MKTGIWHLIDRLGGGRAVRDECEKHLGAVDFELARDAFLAPTNVMAESYPCPSLCGCAHRVVCHPNQNPLAVCQCEDGDCPDIPLKKSDLTLYELSWEKLERALASEFSMTPNDKVLLPPTTRQIGVYGKAAQPVVLTVASREVAIDALVGQLITLLGKGIVLLTPTVRLPELLPKGPFEESVKLFDLDSNVTLSGTGHLAAIRGCMLAKYLLPSTGGKKQGSSPAYRFEECGTKCRVAFQGLEPFFIDNTDGAKYLNYLLHHPNKTIPALELESKVTSKARPHYLKQDTHDARYNGELRQELENLKARRTNQKSSVILDKEIANLEEEISRVVLAESDSTKAVDNIRHAVRAVKEKLRKTGKEPQVAFANYLTAVHVGKECLYSSPGGQIWT